MQYELKPSTPDLAALADEIEVPRSMSPKTALLAGLVLGVTMMVGVLGFIAWRDKQREQEAINLPHSATSTPDAAPTPSMSAAPPQSASAAPSASSATTARSPSHVRVAVTASTNAATTASTTTSAASASAANSSSP